MCRANEYRSGIRLLVEERERRLAVLEPEVAVLGHQRDPRVDARAERPRLGLGQALLEQREPLVVLSERPDDAAEIEQDFRATLSGRKRGGERLQLAPRARGVAGEVQALRELLAATRERIAVTRRRQTHGEALQLGRDRDGAAAPDQLGRTVESLRRLLVGAGRREREVSARSSGSATRSASARCTCCLRAAATTRRPPMRRVGD